MRKFLLVFIVFMCGVFFLACSNQENRLKQLWNFENTINYQQFTKTEMEKIDKLLKSFSDEEKHNKTLWTSGYSQQCYVLRKLYFEEIMSKEDFLNRCINVYERYEKNQKKISFHTTGYAVCLYYLDQVESAKKLFAEILNKSSEKDFTSKSDYEISILICKKFLNKKNAINEEDIYSNLTEEDIINIFCGN